MNKAEKYLKEKRIVGFDNLILSSLNELKSYSLSEILEDFANQRVKEEIESLNLIDVIKDIIPLAIFSYEHSKKNGAHQEFLKEDREAISKAKQIIEHLKKKAE